MKKISILFFVIFLTSVLTACGGTNKSDDNNVKNDPNVINETQPTESIDSTDYDNYVPQKAVPDDLPTYPDAVLTSDIVSFEENSWQWLYSTTGSGNEIVEFFRTELQSLGFEIDEERTIANYEEFFVATTDSIIQIYWLDSDNLSEIDAVTPDTPNRHYSIIVNLDKWEAR